MPFSTPKRELFGKILDRIESKLGEDFKEKNIKIYRTVTNVSGDKELSI